jgi:hypothetical protein
MPFNVTHEQQQQQQSQLGTTNISLAWLNLLLVVLFILVDWLKWVEDGTRKVY